VVGSTASLQIQIVERVAWAGVVLRWLQLTVQVV
jgi:hypothetical protein